MARTMRERTNSHISIKRKRSPPPLRRAKDAALVQVAASLPAAQHRRELLDALERHSVVICVGETGSGKTTQIPQFLYEAAAAGTARWSTGTDKCIAVTQPRRVATVSVATRVAEEMGTDVGGRGAVGYAIRFDDCSSAHTRVKFLTDGVLVRECLADPLLRQYSVVMLDEAHERSIYTDVLLGLLQQLVQRRRDDFRLVVTSATLDHERFAAYFVDIFHAKTHQVMGKRGPVSSYVRAAVETTLQVHHSEGPGHVLVFLTGQREIDDACDEIRALARAHRREQSMDIAVLPLYSALSAAAQRAVFAPVPPHVRKVIVATTIAETSVTIDGVRFVVDCGFCKQKVYDPARHVASLVVVPISKVSAQQRAGRAGRTAPGKCYRLYSKASYAALMDATVPEIQRTNLASVVLALKLLGIHDVIGFPYVDAPAEDALLDALEQLYVLGALDARGRATPLGERMAAFPLEPQLSRALVEAMTRECARDMVTIVSMLSVENVFAQAPPLRRSHRRHRRSEPSRSSGSSSGSSSSDDNSDDAEARDRRHAHDTGRAQLHADGLIDPQGDHLSYLRIARAFAAARDKAQWCRDRHLRLRALQQAQAVEAQLLTIVESLTQRSSCANGADASAHVSGSSLAALEASQSTRLRQSICAGFFSNAARQCARQTVYRLLARSADDSATLVQIHPQSVLHDAAAPPECCVFQELVVTAKPFMRHVVRVERAWIDDFARGRETVALATLYALCGRQVPVERQAHVQCDASSSRTGASRTERTSAAPRVDSAAIAAARARFLARKQQR